MSPLRISLVGFGIIFCSVYGLFQIDLFGGWAWSPGQPEYQIMIVGILIQKTTKDQSNYLTIYLMQKIIKKFYLWVKN